MNVRCPVCESSNVVIHRAKPRIERNSGRCKQAIWGKCISCGYKFFIRDEEVSESKCAVAKRR